MIMEVNLVNSMNIRQAPFLKFITEEKICYPCATIWKFFPYLPIKKNHFLVICMFHHSAAVCNI
jgi:hypothetical protein